MRPAFVLSSTNSLMELSSYVWIENETCFYHFRVQIVEWILCGRFLSYANEVEKHNNFNIRLQVL